MRIVVTGALGHIGSRLVRDLPDRFPNAEILMLDNLSSQRYPSLFNLPHQGRYTVLETDIMTADLEAAFAGADAVVHLAAITDATTSFDNEEEVERVNYQGTMRVAQACANVGTALVFPSTTSVYGTQADAVDEDCSTDDLKPQSPYAESKLMAEDYLRTLSSSGLRHVTCRFGTIFGVSPGMRFHTVVNKFCWQAITGQPLTVWRTALDQKRPYLDLGDAVAAIAFILREGLFDGDVYNVVTVNTSVRAVVDIIGAHVPGVAVEYVDTEIMNQLSYEVSNRRFRTLGFEFRGDLERGIADMMGVLGGARERQPNRSGVGDGQ
jgi:UDP-glucose 4-epimerase